MAWNITIFFQSYTHIAKRSLQAPWWLSMQLGIPVFFLRADHNDEFSIFQASGYTTITCSFIAMLCKPPMWLHNSACAACPALLFCVANKAWLLFPEIQTDHNYVLQNYCNTDFKLKSAMRFCGALALYEFFWPHSWASIIKRQTLGKLCILFGSELKIFQKDQSVFTQLWVVFQWSGNQTYYLKENDVKEKTRFDHLIKRILPYYNGGHFLQFLEFFSLISRWIMNSATNKPLQSQLMLLLSPCVYSGVI